MSVPPTPSKIARPIPYTPKRTLSTASLADNVVGQSSAPPSRATTPGTVPPSTRKYKAPLTTEARPRTLSKPPSPMKRDRTTSRPTTPTTPRRGAHSPLPPTEVSEMDVSRVDPEAALVDSETVEAGDVSVDLDEADLNDYGREDKVLVSIRYVICNLQSDDCPEVCIGSSQQTRFMHGIRATRASNWTHSMARHRRSSTLTRSSLAQRTKLCTTLLQGAMSVLPWMATMLSSLRTVRRRAARRSPWYAYIHAQSES